MILTINDIKDVFSDLISGRISREETNQWANERIQAFDTETLEFSSKNVEELLWDAIIYLCGVDLMISPGEYMYAIEDIRDTYEEILDKHDLIQSL